MKKAIIREEIFKKTFDCLIDGIRVSELPPLKDNYVICIEKDPGYFSENNSYGPFTEVTVLAEREETDEENEIRMGKLRDELSKNKEKRYQIFLQLKKEFES